MHLKHLAIKHRISVLLNI